MVLHNQMIELAAYQLMKFAPALELINLTYKLDSNQSFHGKGQSLFFPNKLID
jgi:hypothetical protein